MKRLNRILTAFLAAGILISPFASHADETRYQYDENFPYGTFSLANFRASLRGLSQMDLMPLRPQAKRIVDGMEYTTTAAATAQYAGTGVTITAETSIKQEGDASLKAVIDATNDRTFSRTFSINLSAFKNITVWTRASSTSSAIQYFLSDGTNSSYWNITTDATANTWKQNTLILATPDANSGSPASLAAVTSYGYRLLDNGVTYYFDTIKAIVGMTVAVRGTDLGSYYRNVYLGISPLQMNMSASPTITAPTTNPRIDILLVDSAGALSWVTGTEASSPTTPWSSVSTNKVPICLVYNKTTETKILDYEDKDTDTNQGYILADVRPFINLSNPPVQGADVASASAVTLGNDGNFFKITGTTTITSITAKPAGTRVALWFTGVLTVTNGSNLKLNGNFVTAADSTLFLVSDGTNWRELSRQPTASTFIKLTDVPSSYSGQALKGVRVNSAATALEFFTRNFIGLGDVPVSFSSQAGKIPRVNAGETALEFINGTRIEVFTSSGTFTAPIGVTKVYLSMIGGGGAGGPGFSDGSLSGTAGGGSAGQCFLNYPYTVVPGNNYAVTIGTGGNNTVFDSLTALAGISGGAASSGVAGIGGAAISPNGATGPAGGVGGKNTVVVGNGGNGGTGGGGNPGGGGGGSPFGAGGASGTAAAANTGAGGGGAPGGSSSSVQGGAGGSGICIVAY